MRFCTSACVFSYKIGCIFSQHLFSRTPLKGYFCLVQVFFCEFCEIFKKIFFIEHLRKTASKTKFFIFFPFFFWSFGNYRFESVNIWSVILESFCKSIGLFLTFTWFNEYFEWVDRYMNFLPLRSPSLHLLSEKRKKYFNVCLTHRKNKPLSNWY